MTSSAMNPERPGSRWATASGVFAAFGLVSLMVLVIVGRTLVSVLLGIAVLGMSQLVSLSAGLVAAVRSKSVRPLAHGLLLNGLLLLGWWLWWLWPDSSSLLSAVRRGDRAAVQRSLALGVSVESAEYWGWNQEFRGHSALTLAARKGDDDMLQLLLARGAAIDQPDGHGNPALVEAAGAGRLTVVQLLMQRGANLAARGRDGDTGLHRAAALGHIQTVEFLLRAGLPIDSTNRSECTPLHLAALAGEIEAVQFLLQQGADPSKRSSFHGTPQELVRNRRGSDARIVRMIDDAIQSKK